MVGWIKKWKKIDGWWMDKKNEKKMDGWMDGMAGWIKNI